MAEEPEVVENPISGISLHLRRKSKRMLGSNPSHEIHRHLDPDSHMPGVSVVIEVGTDLAAWPGVFTVGANTAGSTAGVTVTDNLDGTDTITLTVAQAPDEKKFARLKVVITP